MCHIWLWAVITEKQPDNVGSCFSFLCQELWVMHHLLQEANYPHLQLCVQLKVLRNNSRVITQVQVSFKGTQRQKNQRKGQEARVNCTCECLVTQWRSTFKTRFVAALLITNSLSPFLWSVGKPGTRFDIVTVKLTSYTTEHSASWENTIT